MPVGWLTAFLDRPASSTPAAVRFWTAVTASSLSPRRGERGEFATLLPPDGEAFLRVQTVLDGPGGTHAGATHPGGTHLDVHVRHVAAVAERAIALGATAESLDGYVTLTSPAGLRWCLVPELPVPDGVPAPRRPAPVRRPGGHTSLVDQLCLDLPPDSYDAEGAFWQAVTGWDLRAGSRPEFSYLVRPAGLPLRLLLQRCETPPAGGLRAPASCHLDLACSDVPAEVALHETWGARVLARFPGWTTLEDPTGVPYCITRRDPLTGALPG